jgi:hypothetical protein
VEEGIGIWFRDYQFGRDWGRSFVSSQILFRVHEKRAFRGFAGAVFSLSFFLVWRFREFLSDYRIPEML